MFRVPTNFERPGGAWGRGGVPVGSKLRVRGELLKGGVSKFGCVVKVWIRGQNLKGEGQSLANLCNSLGFRAWERSQLGIQGELCNGSGFRANFEKVRSLGKL